MLLQDREATLAVLHQLRSLGIRIAMDDFGTGYSSLTYLQSFPFDKIKIDRSFVKDITENAGSLYIVRAVAALANGMGMAATAEGVETSEQLDKIAAVGCTEMQGYLFSRSRCRSPRSSGCSCRGCRSLRLKRTPPSPEPAGLKTPARSSPAFPAARRGWRGPAVR